MFYGRNSRRSARFNFWLASPFLATCRIGAVHFDRPDNDGGEGEDGGGSGGPGGAAPVATPAAPAGDDRLSKVLGERKKARQAFRHLLRGLGVDPDSVKVVNTGDPANPIRIEGVGDLDARLSVARAATGAAGGVAGKPGKGATSVELAQSKATTEALRRQNAALVTFIKRTTLVEPIRAACAKYHAIDDDGGKYEDIVNQIAPSGRVDVDFDIEDAAAQPEVRVYFVGRDGSTPLINAATSEPATADSLVLEFLTKRPKYRQANFRSGPGAGGSQVGTAPRRVPGIQTTPINGNGSGKSAERKTAEAVAAAIGGGINPDDLLDD